MIFLEPLLDRLFWRFHVDFLSKMTIWEPPGDPAGVQNPPTPAGVMAFSNLKSMPPSGACPPYPRQHPAGSTLAGQLIPKSPKAAKIRFRRRLLAAPKFIQKPPSPKRTPKTVEVGPGRLLGRPWAAKFRFLGDF